MKENTRIKKKNARSICHTIIENQYWIYANFTPINSLTIVGLTESAQKIISIEPLHFINLKVLISFSFKGNGKVLSR